MRFFCPSSLWLGTFLLSVCFKTAEAVPEPCTNILIVMDESGSMEREQQFLREEAMPNVIEDLRIKFNQRVYVCSWGFAFTNKGRIPLSGRDLGCTVGTNTNPAIYDYVTNGGTEDGYAALKAAIENFSRLTQVDGQPFSECTQTRNFAILVTDEDRDNWDSSLSRDTTLTLLQNGEWTLHTILNNPIYIRGVSGIPDRTEGIGAKEDSRNQWTVYQAEVDPNTASQYTETKVFLQPVGAGPGDPDYAPLSFFTDGVVWDLEKLRQGGFTTQAFTQAFINVTTVEIGNEVTTIAPTAVPTSRPTMRPTSSPTVKPTPTPAPIAPTISPRPTTAAPTSAPTPTRAPTPNPTTGPTRAPITAPPSVTPNICNVNIIYACVEKGAESTFRALLTLLLKDVLTQEELDAVIPPLADEIINIQVKTAIQQEVCNLFSQGPNYDVVNGGIAVIRALVTSQDARSLATTMYNSITSNIDLSIPRATQLLADLPDLVVRGLQPEAFVSDTTAVLLSSLNSMVADCTGELVGTPPIPTFAPGQEPPPDRGFFQRLLDICFSGSSTVVVEGKGVIRMEDLSIGDKVLVESSVDSTERKFAMVYSFGHWDPFSTGEFLQISSDKTDEILEITANHMLYKYDETLSTKKTLVAAESIQIGDLLVTEKGNPANVTSILKVQQRGIYAPLTTTGKIVVGGVLSSNYVTREWVNKKFASEQLLHWLQHGAAQPYRFYCAVRGGCDDEQYDLATGFSKWVQFWYRLEQWHLGLTGISQTLFLSLLAAPAFIAVSIGKVLEASYYEMFLHLLVAVFGYKLVCKAKNSSRLVKETSSKTPGDKIKST